MKSCWHSTPTMFGVLGRPWRVTQGGMLLCLPDVCSHKGGWLKRWKFLNKIERLLKNTGRENACQPGSCEPWRHPWKVQPAALKHSWVPRNQRHPQIILISTETKNWNSNFLSAKVKNSLEKGERRFLQELLTLFLNRLNFDQTFYKLLDSHLGCPTWLQTPWHRS